MRDHNLHMAVLQALDHDRPDAAITLLRPFLAERLQASQLHLLLADCQLTALRSIQDPDDRAPRRQVSGETMLYLPVSIRGDRRVRTGPTVRALHRHRLRAAGPSPPDRRS